MDPVFFIKQKHLLHRFLLPWIYEKHWLYILSFLNEPSSCLVYRNIPDLYRMMRLWKEEAEQNTQSAYINFYKETPPHKKGVLEYLNP